MNAPTRPRRTVSKQDVDLGPAFDEALDRLADLAGRLGQIRAAHPAYRRVRWARHRCAGCGQLHPCPTLRAADPQRR